MAACASVYLQDGGACLLWGISQYGASALLSVGAAGARLRGCPLSENAARHTAGLTVNI